MARRCSAAQMMESVLNALATQRPRELSHALMGSSVASARLRFSWGSRLVLLAAACRRKHCQAASRNGCQKYGSKGAIMHKIDENRHLMVKKPTLRGPGGPSWARRWPKGETCQKTTKKCKKKKNLPFGRSCWSLCGTWLHKVGKHVRKVGVQRAI